LCPDRKNTFTLWRWVKLWNGDKVPEISRLGSIRRAAPYVECNIEDNIHLCPLSVIFALTPKIDDGSRRHNPSGFIRLRFGCLWAKNSTATLSGSIAVKARQQRHLLQTRSRQGYH
jgi:hypothetical protein